MSRAAVEEASQWISYSRAGAYRKAKKFGESDICMPLALDIAAEDAGLDVELVELAYMKDEIKRLLAGRRRNFYYFLELVGGRIERMHEMTQWLKDIKDEETFDDLVLDMVRSILKEAKVEGHLAVLQTYNPKINRGHIAYIKLGKLDQENVFVFDFFDMDEDKKFTYSQLPGGKRPRI